MSKPFSWLFISYCLIILFSTHVSAQEYATIRGLVSDSTSGEALIYANVYVQDLQIGAATDSRGYFVITSVPANKAYSIKASYMGFDSKEITIYVLPNKITQADFKLSPSGVELQSIEKVGEKIVEDNATDLGLQRISIKELNALPKGVETDVFRSLQYIPGIQSTGDVSARYSVRGGGSNENLVMLDGVPIYSPFHALGLFGVIDPDIVNDVEFYKGGYSAEYGGRLSSVMNVITKNGNQNKFGGKASVSLLTGKLLVEGPIPYGSFILSGRQSYSKAILKKFMNDKNVPADFSDYSFKLNYSNPNLLKGSTISVQGFMSNDKIINDSQFIEDFELSNQLFNFNWFLVGDGVPLFLEISFSHSSFEGNVLPKLSDSKPLSNKLSDIGLDLDFTYMFDSKDELGLGFQIKEIASDLISENSLGSALSFGSSGKSITLYGKYSLLRFDKFGADIGSRFNLTRMNGADHGLDFFEPRINLTYTFSPLLTLQAAWGVYQQEVTTVTDERDMISVFEPWIVTPDYLDASKSIHYIFGVKTHPWDNFSLDTEIYYKTTTNLPLLNEEKIEPSDREFVEGEAEAYGVELIMKYDLDFVNVSVAYTKSWAYKIYNEQRYYPKFDTRDNLNLVFDFNFGGGWHSSIAWVYRSGMPFTTTEGYFDRVYVNDFFSNWLSSAYLNDYVLYGVKNLERMPVYHRLDFNISKTFDLSFTKVEVDFSIINVYNRKNVFYYNRESNERVNMLPFLPTATIKVEL